MTLFVVLGMQAQQHVMTVDVSKPTARINPAMYGIFFEDINFGADGGLYAELVKNRSFEFPQPLVGWIPFGEVTVQDERPCFDRNPHYVRITNDGCLLRAGLDNEGYRGIGLKKGEDYRFSAYVRTPDTKPMKLSVELVNSNGENLLKKELEVKGSEWQKLTAVLKAPFTDVRSRLRVVLQTEGTVDMDHISLFPVNTWKKRENGLRADLVQALYDLNPGVFRFPGGCIIEGNSLATRYQWKNSVGPVENRPLNENRWNYTFKHKAFPDYFQSYGLGFYEYFLLSEDLGAEPLPVLSCGLSCQYESNEVVPLGELGPYVQDALDLIEFANGAATSKWGKVRADMGHPEPFGLKMIAIGNEQWGSIYVERLKPFVEAIRAKYPDLPMMLCSGGGGRTDYEALRYFTEFWPSDNTDPFERIFIQWGFSYFFPMKSICAHVTNWNKGASIKFRTDVAMMGKLGFDIIVDKLTAAQREFCRQALRDYDRLKPTILDGDFYRLVSPYEGEHAAVQSVSKDRKSSVVFAYDLQPRYREPLPTVRLSGLDPQTRYRIREINLMPGQKSRLALNGRVVGGDYLMKVGLPLFTAERGRSAVVELQAE